MERPSPARSPRLVSVGTANPPRTYTQQDLLDLAHEALSELAVIDAFIPDVFIAHGPMSDYTFDDSSFTTP